MSIKPIDYVNAISKAEDVAKINQNQNDKVNIHMQEGIIQQKKDTDKNLKKVRDTHKSENNIINNKNEKKNKGTNYNKQDDNQKNIEDEDKYKFNKKNDDGIGNSIDIKV